MVAKDHMHRRRAIFITVDVIQLLGQGRGQPPIAIAHKGDSRAASEHSLVSGHPLHAQAMCNRQHFFGNTALRRPHALRANAEYCLVKIKSAPQLLARVLRMAKSVLRQR